MKLYEENVKGSHMKKYEHKCSYAHEGPFWALHIRGYKQGTTETSCLYIETSCARFSSYFYQEKQPDSKFVEITSRNMK